MIILSIQKQEVTMDIRLTEDTQFNKYYTKHWVDKGSSLPLTHE